MRAGDLDAVADENTYAATQYKAIKLQQEPAKPKMVSNHTHILIKGWSVRYNAQWLMLMSLFCVDDWVWAGKLRDDFEKSIKFLIIGSLSCNFHGHSQ